METAAGTILSWNTKKEADGTFTAIVTELTTVTSADGSELTTQGIVKRVRGWKTRAKARGNAIAWMRYAKAQIDKAAA